MYNLVMISQALILAVLFFELNFVLSQKPSKMQSQLVVTLLAVVLIVICYTLEIVSPNLETALLCVSFSYIGVPYAMLETLFFIMTYCRREPSKKTRTVLSTLMLAFPIMVFTNDFHHLYYTSASYDGTRLLSPLVLEHGPLYWLFIAYSVIYLIYCTSITIVEFKRSKTKNERRQAIYVFATAFSSLFAYILYLTGWFDSYDTTMIGYFFSTFFLMILFFKCRLFDTLAYAKDSALTNIVSGLLVLDNRNKFTYINLTAERLLKSDFTEKELITLPEGKTEVQKKERYYTLIKTAIQHDGTIVSYTIEIIDSTEGHDYSNKLEAEVKEKVEELRHVQRRVIASFADIAEARDSDTGLHVKNITHTTAGIIEELKKMGCYSDILTDSYCNYVIDAASMHDMGKLTIPDNILKKPGRLTEEEFEVMKTHSKAGSDIIEKTMRDVENDEYVDIAKQIAMFHHEKWDGAGYPEKLKGEEIPLCARIVAVADVYDALVSERSYKEPMDPEKACNIIYEGRAHHFDPCVVQAFLSSVYKGNQSVILQ